MTYRIRYFIREEHLVIGVVFFFPIPFIIALSPIIAIKNALLLESASYILFVLSP